MSLIVHPSLTFIHIPKRAGTTIAHRLQHLNVGSHAQNITRVPSPMTVGIKQANPGHCPAWALHPNARTGVVAASTRSPWDTYLSWWWHFQAVGPGHASVLAYQDPLVLDIGHIPHPCPPDLVRDHWKRWLEAACFAHVAPRDPALWRLPVPGPAELDNMHRAREWMALHDRGLMSYVETYMSEEVDDQYLPTGTPLVDHWLLVGRDLDMQINELVRRLVPEASEGALAEQLGSHNVSRTGRRYLAADPWWDAESIAWVGHAERHAIERWGWEPPEACDA